VIYLPYVILVTGQKMTDRMCFSDTLSAFLNYNGIPTGRLEFKSVAQKYLNEITSQVFGPEYLADGEWLEAFIRQQRGGKDFDWPQIIMNEIENVILSGKQIVILPDLTYMDDLTALLSSSFGYVHIETENDDGARISTHRANDRTITPGDMTDVIESALSYGADIVYSLTEEGDEEFEEYVCRKTEAKNISMFG
jgi:hypothetical protein